MSPGPSPRGVDEFYIGYAPAAPPGIASRVRLALTGVFLAGAGVALAGAILQGDPGAAEWAPTSTVTGVFRAQPYPRIVIDEGGDVSSLLLVCQGKHAPAADSWCGPAPAGFGAPWVSADRVLDVDRLDGAAVRASGRRIGRLDASDRGTGLFELSSEADGLQVLSASSVTLPEVPDPAGTTVTLVGEIVDPKCFMGVMKPGRGRTHRACAWLCIQGGIPPVLVLEGPKGPRSVVLTASTGTAANAQVLDFIGDTVSITGTLQRRDGMEILQIDPAGPRRVP